MKEWSSTFYNANNQSMLSPIIIVGIYYKTWEHGEHSYVFLGNSQVTYIYAQLVLACKFAMLPIHHRVKGDEPIYKL
jgi:hypothetical protein